MPHTRPLRSPDLVFCGLAVFFVLSAAQPSAAASPRRVRGADRHVAMCAYEAQKAVARRHGLSGQPNDSLALWIYGNPNTAREADDAFDACVRKQKQ